MNLTTRDIAELTSVELDQLRRWCHDVLGREAAKARRRRIRAEIDMTEQTERINHERHLSL
jgi:hypothetical protein